MKQSTSTNTDSPKESIWQRFKRKYITWEMFNYVLFGTFTTIVNYLAYFLFMKAPFVNELGNLLISDQNFMARFPNMTLERLTPLLVNIIAWVIAVLYAFIVNKLFVFKSKSWKPSTAFRELGGFITARLLSLGFEELFLFLTVTLGGMNKYLSKVLAAVFVMIMNYFASKLLIFKKKGEQ